jgi:hypothetical protein
MNIENEKCLSECYMNAVTKVTKEIENRECSCECYMNTGYCDKSHHMNIENEKYLSECYMNAVSLTLRDRKQKNVHVNVT